MGLPPGVSPSAGYGAPPGAAQEQLAPVSAVLGVVSLLFVFCCGPLSVVFGLTAVGCGIVSVSRIHKEPHRYRGKGLAITGIVVGALGLFGYLLIFVIFGAMSFYHSSF